MENFFTKNIINQTTPLYSLSISSGSDLSSGFDSDFSDITSDVEPKPFFNNKNDINVSCESLMDSDFLVDDTYLNEKQENAEYLTVFDSNQLNSNQITQLWQFLLEILEDKKYENLIRWNPLCAFNYKMNNEHDNEFIIYDTKEVARLWGVRRNKPNMNHKKFNRILRHYYNKKNILRKPACKRNTYYFQINIQPYLQFLKVEQDRLNKKQQQCQYMQFF